jgi:hypothetical protein
MGAFKVGVQIVTFAEKDNADALDHALRTSNARGLIFNPDSSAEGINRGQTVNKLMPELAKMYFGDELNIAKYPNLKQIVQTRFAAIRGINLFKDVSVYANP